MEALSSNTHATYFNAEVLRNAQLLQGLEFTDIEAIANTAELRFLKSGEYIYNQDDQARYLYLLISGRFKVLQNSIGGKQVILRIISPGQVFGPVGFLTKSTRIASAIAVEDSRALAFNWGAMTWILERFPRVAVNALQIVGAHLQELEERFQELSFERVERRIARTLLRLVKSSGKKQVGRILIDLPLTHEDIAEMTGTTIFTVTRILKRWEKNGLIAMKRASVAILDPLQFLTLTEDLPEALIPDSVVKLIYSSTVK